MAIEKMKTVGMVGKITDMDRICRIIVLNGSMHMLNTLTEINSNNFKLSASEENLEAIEESMELKAYTETKDFAKEEEVIKILRDIFDLRYGNGSCVIGIDYDYNEMMSVIHREYDSIKELGAEIDSKKRQVEEKKKYILNLGYLKDLSINPEQLLNLKFLDFRLLKVSRENYGRLKGNYENIPSLMQRLETLEDYVILMSAAPKSFNEEIERILTSINYQEMKLPGGYTGTAEDVIKVLKNEIESLSNDIKELKRIIKERKKDIEPLIKETSKVIELEKEADKIKKEGAIGKKLFFLFGYVPESKVNSLLKELQDDFGNDMLLTVDDAENKEAAKAPPTKFKNNWLVRPFEMLIRMYGLPSYGEIDPTIFFGLSYMLLFGAMFGDLGQGFIIFMAGIYLIYKKKSVSFGGILSRLGGSSMAFGLLYGSVFGNEHLLPALFIRPMAKINTMLILAIALGVILMTISFIYSLLNNLNRHDIEEGLFGREGLTGFLFFITLITAVANSQLTLINVGMKPLIMIMAVLLLLNVFKQPLANKIKGSKKLYEESTANYYAEAGFGVVETILSFLSNTISFVRVGAFALNHAGLYLAFETIAEMISSGFGGIVVLIIGNLVIIGLEGLIVFIQGLRLEYYELFSRYYSGKGIEYAPVRLNYMNNLGKDTF